ncbi:hypothetical protein FSP39_002240 [Pinctada imbricata]|uniref:Mab-21-like HhH/H2TH-like domain-containing protein n=1 Tax=Pinctada imbricata TaxID=66713 RepID=A0AA88YAW6_PINIB|nr:hypothetical protein FSP39_002240 [Pinctada imbricata]
MEAVGCVQRLLRRRWPSDDVIKNMVSDGCLFVPIGCKMSPYEDIEWRMSFSLAEKRLVRFMNHTQFLTYGLLKLFLKEVVEENDETRGLLCSYFMKTLVFWEIIESDTPWRPSCFLHNVWNCFRRLLSWIGNEYCPNFFIPENNMFCGKIHGRSKQTLLSFLCRYYRAGRLIFTEIPSMRRVIDGQGLLRRKSVSNVFRRSSVIQRLYSPKTILAHGGSLTEFYDVLDSSQLPIIKEYIDYLRLHELNLSCFKMLCCQIGKACHNRTKYLIEKSLFRLVRASSPDCARGKIFIALYFYRCKRYANCISLLHKVIKTLEDVDTMYKWQFDTDKYSSLGGDELSISEGMCKFTASNVPLESETCIPEISDECNSPGYLFIYQFISPWVLSHFLLFLCHFWKGDLTQARVHLGDIRNCLQNCRHHISFDTYPLSWQILGIGQDIIGDFQNALMSYSECERILGLDQRKGYNDLLEVNKKRSSRLMSLLSSQRRRRHRRHPRTQKI